jgi:hypothetical protein
MKTNSWTRTRVSVDKPKLKLVFDITFRHAMHPLNDGFINIAMRIVHPSNNNPFNRSLDLFGLWIYSYFPIVDISAVPVSSYL